MSRKLEAQVTQWRAHLLRRAAGDRAGVEKLESHLREQVAALRGAGLAADEAFLISGQAAGRNLILLVNLAGSAWLYARFLRGRGTLAALERWQTAYLPVYAVWAGLVVAAFPPLFGYR